MQMPLRRCGCNSACSAFTRWHSPLSRTTMSVGTRFIRTKTLTIGSTAAATVTAASLPQVARVPTSSVSTHSLAEVVEATPEIEAFQTLPDVWAASTLEEAWRRLHVAHATARDTDPARAGAMLDTDFVALALCAARSDTMHLMSLLPPDLHAGVVASPTFNYADVEEFFIHLGQTVEVRGGGGTWMVHLSPPSEPDLRFVLRQIGRIGDDGRGCIAHTAHRVSVWRDRAGAVLGVTVRVGRYVPNAARVLLPLARTGSVLIISKAGMGKTTLLRDLAASLAQGPGQPRVAIVDTSNEIGGDGACPLPFLGRCRRLQVPRREAQSAVMVEAIQNHTPEFLVVDELANAAEAEAAWSIAQRGVRMIATCHGESLESLLQNQALNMLVGGSAQAFLSNEERRLRNKTKKTILERPYNSPFQFVVELTSRDTAFVYTDVNKAVDLILDDQVARNDASVGVEVWLAQPPSVRLEALVLEQEARRRGAKASNKAEDGAGEKQDDAYDEDGYVVRNPPRPLSNGAATQRGGRRSGQQQHHQQRQVKRKTNGELYEELTNLF